jgi:hypothetical protein
MNVSLKNVSSTISPVAFDFLWDLGAYFRKGLRRKIINKVKCPMQPIPAQYANHIINKYLAGDSNKKQTLNRIRVNIRKEHVKMVLWLEIYENYKGLAGNDYTLKKIQYEYEQDSLIWKVFYGKDKSDVDMDQAFKEWMGENKITQVMLNEIENPSS